jgi:predicted TIM-barrel fold metal-dependent hydrolase
MIASCEPGEKMLPKVVAATSHRCVMYASDYPHGDSKWPQTVSRIRSAGLFAETQERILGENAAQLYNIEPFLS